jgi:hypothetical protein
MSSREKPNVVCVRSFVPKREELRFAGNLVGGERATRHLDHRPHEIVDLDALLLHGFGRDAIDDVF